MKKVVVRTGGDSLGIRFTKPERKAYNIEEDDVIDISEDSLRMLIKQAGDNISNLAAKQRQPETINKIKGIINDDSGFQE